MKKEMETQEDDMSSRRTPTFIRNATYSKLESGTDAVWAYPFIERPDMWNRFFHRRAIRYLKYICIYIYLF